MRRVCACLCMTEKKSHQLHVAKHLLCFPFWGADSSRSPVWYFLVFILFIKLKLLFSILSKSSKHTHTHGIPHALSKPTSLPAESLIYLWADTRKRKESNIKPYEAEVGFRLWASFEIPPPNLDEWRFPNSFISLLNLLSIHCETKGAERADDFPRGSGD